MSTSPHLELQQDLIIYPRLLWAGRKQLLVGIPLLLLFIGVGFFTIIRGESTLIYSGVVFFAIFGLLTAIIQLTWGPFLMINDQEIQIRPNPFLQPVKIQWNEITSITLFRGKRDFSFDIALSSPHIEAFLHRQSPLNKKILSRRLSRIHRVARFPQLLLPCSLRTLLETIQERYYMQIQKYHITIAI